MTPRDQQARVASEAAVQVPLEAAGVWQTVYHNSSPQQQAELLALARRQGILYAHQLTATNGHVDPAKCQSPAGLLAGNVGELSPVQPAVVQWLDPELDEAQREAVGKALATPDICLIQGLPGTGKSRVAAEVIAQAAERGQRVLFLARTPAAVDRVLDLVGKRDSVLPVRCLASAERPEDLAPAIRGFTANERLQQFDDLGARGAQQESERSRLFIQKCEKQESLLQEAREIPKGLENLEQQWADLQRRRDALAAEVERAADLEDTPGEFGKTMADLRSTHSQTVSRIEKNLADLDRRRQGLQEDQGRLQPQIATLSPLCEIRQQGRWWNPRWWRALLSGNVQNRLQELETNLSGTRNELTDLDEEETKCREEKESAQRLFLSQRRCCCDEEAARRQALLDQDLASLEQQRGDLKRQWQQAVDELDAECPRPEQASIAAVESAIEECKKLRSQREQWVEIVRDWAGRFDGQGCKIGAGLIQHANLVAAPFAAWAEDPHFGTAGQTHASFDYLVLEEAHQFTEAEFLQVNRSARRWILVAEADLDNPAPPKHRPRTENQVRNDSSKRKQTQRGKPPARGQFSPTMFQRMWNALHCDPRRLPYGWYRESGRWCCRLRHSGSYHADRLERECVADSPDIELRILTVNGQPPALVEVAFPPTMSIAQAKQFVFHEVEELPVRVAAHSLCWHEEKDRCVLRLSHAAEAPTVTVPLSPGVQETVFQPGESGERQRSALDGLTCCIDFERQAGWNRQRAEEWVAKHWGLRDLGRTVWLDVPYRMHQKLAEFVSDVLFDGAYQTGATLQRNGRDAAVEFIPVPALEDSPAQARHANGAQSRSRRPRIARTGAGLELDLADARHRSRLPSELTKDLPQAGIVNLFEAQALVRTLERMVKSGALRASGDRASVGIVALYHGQAALIQALIRQSAGLRDLHFDQCVSVPDDIREREFATVLLSLTRSHSHRAVSYGNGPAGLTLALTRARRRLLVFGDPGTLARRCQWEKPVDHLAETAAARERTMLTRLLGYLQGKGGHPQAFYLYEGIQV